MKRLSPKSGHVFFFPNRGEGKQVVVGQKTWVRPFEEWKHIEVGFFDIEIGEKDGLPNGQRCILRDGMDCLVTGKITLEISSNDEHSLKILSKTIEPSRRIEDIHAISDQVGGAAAIGDTFIRKTLKEIDYLEFLDDVVVKKVEADIVENLSVAFSLAGFMLSNAGLRIEPLEPTGVRANREMIDQWLDFERIRQEQEARIEELRYSHRCELEDLKLEDFRLNQDRQQKKHVLETQLRIKKQAEDLEAEKKIAEIQREIELLGQEIQKRQLAFDAEIEESKVKNKFSLEDEKLRLAQNNKEQHDENKLTQLHEELKQIRIEGELEIAKAQVLDAKRTASEKDFEIEYKQGEAKAKLVELTSLGNNAATIKINESMAASVAELAAELAKPLSCIKEAKVISIQGAQGEGGFSGLSHLTALPIIKEVLSFFEERQQVVESVSDDDGKEASVIESNRE